LSSMPPETAAPAAETSSQPSLGRLTDYDRLVDDLAYNDVVHAADVIVSTGCGDACLIYPGKRYRDWEVADPNDQPIDNVRDIRDDLQARITALLHDLNI
jgi:hypothetical protein